MEIKINEFAQEVHENAIAHGWWDEKRSFPEIIALIHSEVSEALEEYRMGFDPDLIYPGKDGKPEGLPVELADAILRILDYCACVGIDIEEALKLKHAYYKERPYRHGGKVC